MFMTGEAEYSEKNLPHCHFIHHKSHVNWLLHEVYKRSYENTY